MRMRLGIMATIFGIAQAPAQMPVDTAPPRAAMPPVDYARADAWICRPGVGAATCAAGLDAIAVDAAGARVSLPFAPIAAAAIDCFYIYPTVSRDRTMYADMAIGSEERHAVHEQAARLSSRCRLFVPAYRQLTAHALGWALAHGGKVDFDPAYADVLAAWRSYLAHDNRGRGVVLVGHSQGAILLKRLIAAEIDGRSAGRQLVGAYLAGNPDLGDRSFSVVKPCMRVGEIGCVVAWSSYLADDTSKRRAFGGASGGRALCTNPASPGGGRGALKAYLPKPAAAPAADPPYVEALGQLTAECVVDGAGSVLRVRVEPSRYAELLRAGLTRTPMPPGWGLHMLDISLVQGNLLDLIAAQSAAWARRR